MSANAVDPAPYREALLRQRRALEETAATGDEAAGTVELDQSRVGRVSRVDALQAQAMSIETRRRREEALSRIDAALARIEAGEFGWCLRCGEAIDPGRLEVDPAAFLCIDCARGDEAP